MRLARLLIWLIVSSATATGCGSSQQQVQDATEASRSWAATVKVVTEQWAQSRVSLRFTRTTLNTAIGDLYRQSTAIRSVDPQAASRIDRLKDAIDPVMAAVALNQPDQARDLAQRLTAILEPEPVPPTARPQ
jgi:hypothetical protein